MINSTVKIGDIVTVMDTGNYKYSYSEPTPFVAELYDITGHPCYWVRSKDTGKEYELYGDQIKEIDYEG